MKIYTTLKQSKELAKILPLDTADMCYKCLGEDPYDVCLRPYSEWKEVYKGLLVDKEVDVIPCWSLAALLEEIPSIIVNNVGEDLKLHIEKDNLQYYLFYENEYTGDMFEIETELYDDMIDAAFEMIIELHELNLL